MKLDDGSWQAPDISQRSIIHSSSPAEKENMIFQLIVKFAIVQYNKTETVQVNEKHA
ncbi:MAG: hypothetical protein KKG47_14515 [Proteobacteria bacterium]|nr:hypothetical protein [Pseudomonadota bacterium]MBU1739253.1 hypothetical protein [Pseudomonadota bacterium]